MTTRRRRKRKGAETRVQVYASKKGGLLTCSGDIFPPTHDNTGHHRSLRARGIALYLDLAVPVPVPIPFIENHPLH